MRAAAKYMLDSDICIFFLRGASPSILVTNNIREFNRIPGLNVENWV